jgi:hypothetical protein
MDFILDESRAALGGHRRTDLVRFGKFTGGSYLWPWKVELLVGHQHNLRYIPSCSTIFKF